ncbi:MAG: hypothetical protein ABL886_06815 [Rhodoglobus sp.]
MTATVYSVFCPACGLERRRLAQANATKTRLRKKRERLGLEADPDDEEAELPDWKIKQMIDQGDRRTWRLETV